ncbi:MAG: dTMP kinase [Candidatus Sericytochromatia bacterium]
MFITFEGVEGAGKTTQIGLLKNFLEEKGKKVIITREPGGTILGKKIRHLILNPDEEDKPSKMCELMLYIADRAHHVENLINKHLEEGFFVISDRYVDSSIAYQGYARGANIEQLILLNDIATKGLKPNITFILDIDPQKSMDRISKERVLDRMELEKIDFHIKVRNGFLKIAEKDVHRVKIINADKSIDEVKKDICSYF